MITDVLVAFDHLRHEVTILANVEAGAASRLYEEAAAAIAEVRERLRGPVPVVDRGAREPPEFASNPGPDGYAARPSSGRRSTSAAGDAYQVVPSQRWTARLSRPTRSRSTAGCGRSTRARTCTSCDFEDFQIAGASPESLVQRRPGAHVQQRPIAGTRPRARRPRRTDSARRELLADPKERAEHVMLVDLARNDLGRVCEYGSVTSTS